MTADRSFLRWVAVATFALASALNYLDRSILNALQPQLLKEFGLTLEQFGYLISAFSFTYAFAAPCAGWFIDRVGLTRGGAIVVGLWSLAGVLTGMTTAFTSLILCRMFLGLAEGGGIPGSGKTSAVYLKPGERAMGSAISQVGLSIGSIIAPVLCEYLSIHYGWRSAFLVVGAAGFLWIPLWLAVARIAPRVGETSEVPVAAAQGVSNWMIWSDRRYWSILLSNVLLMTVYSMWTNWTTAFLVKEYRLTQSQTNFNLAWIPPIFATIGGFAGGWLVLRWNRTNAPIIRTRMRVILLGAVLLLCNAAIPFVGSPAIATGVICFSYLSCLIASVNIYSLPLDLYGARAAAFAVAGLTGVYGLLQTVISPLIGRVADHSGFGPVCLVLAFLPLCSWAVLRWGLKNEMAGTLQ